MRRWILPLVALTLVGAAPQGQREGAITRLWIAAVLAHDPGAADGPLIDVASFPSEHFQAIRDTLPSVLRHDFDRPEQRNNVLRRGAVLHTDLALLLPEQAVAFDRFAGAPTTTPLFGRPRYLDQPASTSVVTSRDGEYMNTQGVTAHWAFASMLLNNVAPSPARDEFVAMWYRAIAAAFQSEYLLGSATYHMQRALQVLPKDPTLLFYAGAMYEAFASPRFQNILLSVPAGGPLQSFPSRDDQLRLAERFFRGSIKDGGPAEAQLRLGRVVGRLGRHAEAVAILQRVAPERDSRLTYFRELFLGTELGDVGDTAGAIASLDRAEALYPTAQAPLITMGEVLRRAGDRDGARAAMRRLQALPPDPSEWDDPWWAYHRSYAADAERQVTAVRAWVRTGGSR